jgi:hypothetical protein
VNNVGSKALFNPVFISISSFIFTPWRKQAKTSFRKYSFFSEEVLAVLA